MSATGNKATQNLSAELVIIGGGGAGLAAALAAKENGAGRVIVLEKRGTTGGNTAISSGLFGADSPAQKRIAVEFRRDELFRIAMNFAHWKINPRIVRAFIDKSGDTIRWLEEKGLHFDIIPFYPNQDPLVWHITEARGAGMMKVLAEECRKLGVEILTRTPARKLLTGPGGEVTGAVATGRGGKFTVTTSSVIIASGGFGGNKRLLRKYCPQYRDNMECDGLPHTGDGLLMALEVGAATEGLGLMLMSGPQIPGKVSIQIDHRPEALIMPLMAVTLEPNTVWVNKNGVRFADEAIGYHHFVSSNAVNRQPDNLCYVLLDQRLVETMTEQGLLIGLGRHRVPSRIKMPGLERELRLKEGEGWVKIADSWDGIAGWIGATPGTLKATIDEYNSACDRGYDPVYAKDRVHLVPLRTPPYYAIRSNSDLLDTIGGIRINEHMEVLDKQDRPIRGLFAAGVVTGGWEGDTYCGMLSGTASGFAINSGRIAGENALKFARQN